MSQSFWDLEQARKLRQQLYLAPAFTAAIFLVIGIALHKILPARPTLFLTFAALTAITAILFARHHIVCTTTAALAILSFGLAAAQIEDFYYPINQISVFTTTEPISCELELRIADYPRIIPPSQVAYRAAGPRQSMRATVLRIHTQTRWQPSSGTTTLTLQSPNPLLAAGQRVHVIGNLARPSLPMNPGEFDWSAYYRDQRILTSVTTSHPESVQILDSRSPSALVWLQQHARNLLDSGFDQSNAVDHALLRALVLGDTDPQLRDVQDAFVRSGTSHLLAISGAHIGILALFIYFICRLLLMSPHYVIWIVLGFVLLYGFASLPSPSVLRATIMCVIFLIAQLSRRAANPAQLLGLSALVMLAISPLDFYNAGFELSFIAVAALLIIAPRIHRKLSPPPTPEKLVLQPIGAPSLPMAVSRWIFKNVLVALCAAIAAWLVAAPLVALHFDQINPYAIPVGLILSPIVTFALIAGFLKLMLTLLLPTFAHQWASLSTIPVSWMRRGVEAMGNLPGGDLPLPAPPAWMIAIYFALLLLPLIPIARSRIRALFRFTPTVPVICALALPLMVGLSSPASHNDLRLTLLSVGAGQCAVLELPSGKTILIDAGSSTITDVQRRIIIPYLRRQGDRTIDAIILSHPDYDHISAAGEIASRYQTKTVMIDPFFRQQSLHDPFAQSLLDEFAQLHCDIQKISAGDHLKLGPDTIFDVLSPQKQTELRRRNDTSLVLRLTCHGRSILLPADIQESAEIVLLENPTALKSDVLIAPHHGSRESTTEDFINAVNPSAIISSNSHRLSRKQRDFDTLVANRPNYRTDRTGAITITITPDGNLNITTFR